MTKRKINKLNNVDNNVFEKKEETNHTQNVENLDFGQFDEWKCYGITRDSSPKQILSVLKDRLDEFIEAFFVIDKYHTTQLRKYETLVDECNGILNAHAELQKAVHEYNELQLQVCEKLNRINVISMKVYNNANHVCKEPLETMQKLIIEQKNMMERICQHPNLTSVLQENELYSV